MTSEERVRDHMRGVGAGIWANSEEEKEALINTLDQHAAEARAEQRHMCAKDSRIALFDLSPDAKPITTAYVVEQACLNAVEKSDE